jgi:hypothetical protein
MLSRIDEIIYPNRCEVIEIEPSQRYIYPIFKNGHSSLVYHARDEKFKILINEQIKRLDVIDVVLRNPVDRFIVGVNAYVYNEKLEHPQLDVKTIIYFAETYLFLNRHYAPQISWLLNLNRYTSPTAKLRLHDMSALSEFTPLTRRPYEDNMLSESDIARLKLNSHNEMYLKLDQLLIDLIGQELTFSEILKYINTKEPGIYKRVLS